MQLASGRIELDPAPVTPRSADPLEVLLLGHCPGEVRSGRLSLAARSALRELGLLDAAMERADLAHVPLRFGSISDFQDVFPTATTDPTTSRPVPAAGPLAWLPRAVEDYFDAGGLNLWVVVVPEREEEEGFLPPPASGSFHDPARLRGVELVALLENVGLVAAPDLERLLVPQGLPDVEEFAGSPPLPRFLPLRSLPRTRGEDPEPAPSARARGASWNQALVRIAGFLARHRPDVQALLSLPLAARHEDGLPALDPRGLDALEAFRAVENDGSRRAVQLLYPYLRGPRYRMVSAAGRVAGAIHRTVRTSGAWRSVAGRPLAGDGVPFPPVGRHAATRLREDHDVGVLELLRGDLLLDDERSPSRAFARSAEAVRFFGYLRRQLENLGRALVFDLDPRDPRPQLALEHFLGALHRAGALGGRLPEDAYRVTRRAEGSARVVYEIEVALAFPIDRIRLTLVHTQGSWIMEDARD